MRPYIPIFVFITCFLLLPISSANIINFYVDQKEYYFLTGQDAVVPYTIKNTFDNDVTGTLTYAIIQTINQGGMQYSSTRSNSQSFTVQKGNQTIGMNFGTSQTPLTLTVNMEFSFHQQDDYIISLDDIIIHFVSNESQMQNQQNPQQSTSERIINAPQQKDQQEPPQQPQTAQEKLQNNQLNQDSQALKEQMQHQMQQEQKQQEAFKQNVMNHSQVQDLHEDLEQQGYTITDESFQAETNKTGDFSLTYQNEQGETATMQGRMNDGDIEQIQTQTAQDRRNMLETLNQSTQFQEFQNQLRSEGYNKTDISFEQQGNRTTVSIEYQNQQNKTAVITAEFYDEELEEVFLEKQDDIPYFYLSLVLFIILLIGVFLLYRTYLLKRKKEANPLISVVKQPFDYRSEAHRLLTEATQDFEKGLFKEAYQKAGQSLRLFLSYHYGLNKEITNHEMIRYLKQIQQPHEHIKQCLDLCSLVEFAKYSANQSDFSKIVQTTKHVISQ